MNRYLAAILMVLVIGGPALGATYDIGPGQTYETHTALAAAVTVQAGDVIDGGGNTFRENWAINGDGVAGNPVIVQNATILGSTAETATSAWDNDEGGNLWETADSSFTSDVSFVLFGSESQANVGVRVADKGDLDAAKKWYYDPVADNVVVYSVGNPFTVYGNIEISARNECVTVDGRSYVTIRNVTAKYYAQHAIGGADVNYIITEYNTLGWGGGTDNDADGSGDLGNTIQFHTDAVGSSSYIYIRYNTITQDFDYGIGPQVFQANDSMNHVYIYGNNISRCGGGIQLAAITNTGETISTGAIYDNDITNIGYGWSGYDVPSGHGDGIVVSAGNGNTTTTVDVYSNTVDTFAGAGIRNRSSILVDFYSNTIKNGTGAYTSATNGALKIDGSGTTEPNGYITNNRVFNNTGIHGAYIVNSSGLVSFLGNTFYLSGDAAHSTLRSATSSNETVKDNIFYLSAAIMAAVRDGADVEFVAFDANDIYKIGGGTVLMSNLTEYASLAAWNTGETRTDTGLETDPQFVNAAAGDFRPKAELAGIWLDDVPRDFNGCRRYRFFKNSTTPGVEMGAYNQVGALGLDSNYRRWPDQCNCGVGVKIDNRKLLEE